jgi:DNA-binding NtrC family response regulator
MNRNCYVDTDLEFLVKISNIRELEEMITDALISSCGNISKAAEQLGITERIMGLRISKYHITPQKYKNLSNEN